MPNIRLTLADGLPLFIPAHSVKHIETILPDAASSQALPDAESFIIYDIGKGPDTAFLSTSAALVAEQVAADPKVGAPLLRADRADGGMVWLFPEYVVALMGYRPPPGTEDATLSAANSILQIRLAGEGLQVYQYMLKMDAEEVQAMIEGEAPAKAAGSKRKTKNG